MTRWIEVVETRSGMMMFARAVREQWPMEPADRDAAITRLREVAAEDRGRVSQRAAQTVAVVAHLAATPASADLCQWGRAKHTASVPD